MLYSLFCISVGASLGAICRWFLNQWLNPVFAALPLGTLAANWLGSYLIGFALSLFALLPAVAAKWGLVVVTGFLGAFTTFSSFSAEIVVMIQNGRWGWALGGMALHVFGSIAMTFLGMGTFFVLFKELLRSGQ